jgi:hypothetical protein
MGYLASKQSRESRANEHQAVIIARDDHDVYQVEIVNRFDIEY